MIQYYLYKFGQFCVRQLPTELSYKIAIFISDVHYYFCSRDRRIVKNNLKIILSSDENLSYLARESFRNFGKYLVDFFKVQGSLTDEYVRNHVTIEHIEYLTDTLKEQKGAIIVTAHMGNWELGGCVLSKLGYPPIAVALPHKERSVNDLFNAQRAAEGMTIVPNSVAIRECIKGLRKNRIVALLADRDFNLNGEVVNFFGKKTIFPKGPAAFSLKTGAVIVPTFLIREQEDHFKLFFEKPISLFNDDGSRIALGDLIEKYAAAIESNIKKYPTQWFMFQKFWIE